MALPKKQLRAKLYENGITDENALSELMTWIMDANSASLDGLREQLDEANANLSALQNVKADFDRVSGELETVKASGGDAAKIQKDFDDYKAAVDAEKVNGLKVRLVRQALLDDGANPDAVDLMMKGEDMSGVELDGEALKDRDAAIKPYRDAHGKWFGTTSINGVPETNPPTGGGRAEPNRARLIYEKHRAERYGEQQTKQQ